MAILQLTLSTKSSLEEARIYGTLCGTFACGLWAEINPYMIHPGYHITLLLIFKLPRNMALTKI